MLRVGKVLILVLGLFVVVGQCFGSSVCTNTPSNPPLYNQCPAIGCNTGCAYLIVIADTGVTMLNDASQGPYEGHDDMLIGVQNNTAQTTIYSINLSGSEMNDGALKGIFNLADSDIHTATPSDGICGYWPGTSTHISPAPPACPYGPTLYEGPNTSYSNIGDITNSGVPDSSGTVNFTNGLIPSGVQGSALGVPGSYTYFSLEDAPTDASLITIPSTYTLKASSLSGTVSGGGTPFTTTITLAGGLPSSNSQTGTSIPVTLSQSSCSITPTPPANSVTCSFTGTQPMPLVSGVGANTQTSTLTITTTAAAAAGLTSGSNWQPPLLFFWTLGLGSLSLLAWKVMPLRKPAFAVAGCVMLLAAVFVAGCSSSGSPNANTQSGSTTAATTYTIAVTGSPQQSNPVSDATITLTVH